MQTYRGGPKEGSDCLPEVAILKNKDCSKLVDLLEHVRFLSLLSVLIMLYSLNWGNQKLVGVAARVPVS